MTGYMKQASIRTLTAILTITAALSLFATAAATSTVSVYVMDPYNSANGGLGQTSNSYWVGQIPIRVTSGATTSQTLSYCMNADREINIGSTYTATLATVTDNAEWRAVSYVLTWNNPTSNSEASAAQVAVWRLLNQTRGTNYVRPSWLTTTLDNAGNTLANVAYGKDVIHQGDTLAWISPITGNLSAVQGEPGQTYTFVSRLTDANGAGRANVKMLFNATLNSGSQTQALNSTYVSAVSGYTDSQGNAQATVTVPQDATIGTTISIKASTKSIWPQRYIDISSTSTQDLLGTGETLQLTVSTNVCVYGFITVLPESPSGP